MSSLYMDLFFYGMVKSTLVDADPSAFRGINRMVHEYAMRTHLFTGFSHVHLFGSRLPNLTKSSFAAAGLNLLEAPPTPSTREQYLDRINTLDRRKPPASPLLKKLRKKTLATARLLLRRGLMNDLYLPQPPQKGDLWLSTSTCLTPQVRALDVTRVLICHDLNHIFHYREMGLEKPITDPLANLALDLRNDEWAICISEYTRDCLLRYHPTFPPERAFVVPLGADLAIKTTASSNQQILEKYHLQPQSYFMTLAAGAPHKNTAFIAEEFATWCTETNPPSQIKLLLAGLGQDTIRARLSPLAETLVQNGRILFTGYVPDSDLPVLYGDSLAFVLASLAEGFGLPPLEAMVHGAPVLCSNRTSLPEVVGDAGILFDPTAKGVLPPLFTQLLNNPTFRQTLSQKSLQRSANFTWTHATQSLATVLHTIQSQSS